MISIPTPRASVVIVSYNSEATLAAAVASVPDDIEVVVVENSSTGTAKRVAQESRRNVVGISSGRNRGFGAGCNLGAASARGDVLIFLNPDAMLYPGAADLLVESALRDGVGMVGPSIVEPDGVGKTEARNWSAPLRDALDLIVPSRIMPNAWRRDIPMQDARYRLGGEVPYVQGACMAVSRKNFFAVGGFDEMFFLYGEEEHLAQTLFAKGLVTMVEPRAQISHIGQTSTHVVGEFATVHLFRSYVLTYARRSGLLRAAGGATTLGLAIALLWVTWPLRRVLGFRKTYSSNWCRNAAAGVRLGLRSSVGMFDELPVTPLEVGEAWADER